MAAKRFSIYTLGCKLNFAEGTTLGRSLQKAGMAEVAYGQVADYLIVNTCSVTDHADRKCKKVVREGLRNSPAAQVIIVGCYAQLKPKEILEIPGVNLVLGAQEKFNLASHIATLQPHEKRAFVDDVAITQLYQSSYSATERTRAFLKVQDGCDYTCSFCTIPLARGASRSNTIAKAVEEAEALAHSGIREIVLTGVNLGDFGAQPGQKLGVDRPETFLMLAKALDDIDADVRFRISSIEPNLLSDQVIAFVSTSKRFARHFHIPLQSGSNTILASMRRRYRRELYESRIALIKQLMPDCCIGVDVIVGYPGETQALFDESKAFIESLNVDYLHVFPYSERQNTLAKTLGNKVQDRHRNNRVAELNLLSAKKKAAFYQSQIGTTHQVIFEEQQEGNQMFGFSENYVKVAADYNPLHIGERILCQLIQQNPDSVLGEILDSISDHHSYRSDSIGSNLEALLAG